MMPLLKKSAKGQGVVEYAGALVVAALVVAAVIGIGPDSIETMFDSLLTSISDSLTGEFSG